MNEQWKSEHIQITTAVFVDVKANEAGVVLGQGNDVWFHDLHITPEQACAIADALTQGAAKCLAMRSGS
jgi:hypothetical protein